MFKIKIAQLADDTTVFVKNEASVERVIQVIERFGALAGLVLNKLKTEGIQLGKGPRYPENLGNISWPTAPIKALGLFFGHDRAKCDEQNWDQKVRKIQDTIASWEKRNLTYYGKILVIKTLLLSKLIHCINALVMPDPVINKVEKLFYNFLWGSKKEKVKRRTLIGPLKDGGLEMIDLRTFIHVQNLKFLHRLFFSDDGNWKHIPTYYLNKPGHNFLIFKLDMISLKSYNNSWQMPDYYKHLIESWYNCKGLLDRPVHFKDIRRQIIWGNRHVLHKNKPLWFQHWVDSGIVYVDDLLSEERSINPQYIRDKLKDKRNWVAEYYIVINSLPLEWRTCILSEESRRTNVKLYHNLTFKISGTDIPFTKTFNFKLMFCHVVKLKFERTYQEKAWCNVMQISYQRHLWTSVWNFVYYLQENKLKQFRFRILHNILPCAKLAYRWKIVDSPNCIVCHENEDYEHLFFHCKRVKYLWDVIKMFFDVMRLNNIKPTLKALVLGYKIRQSEYNYINYFLTVIFWGIYKEYCQSENRTKRVNTLNVVKNEIKHRLQTCNLSDREVLIFSQFIEFI